VDKSATAAYLKDPFCFYLVKKFFYP